MFGGSSSNTPTSSTYSAPTEAPRIDPKDEVKNELSLDFKWSKGAFESAMIADFTITNNSDRSVKDLTITCTHYASSGTKIDSNTRPVYEVVPAHGKKRVRDFNMGFISLPFSWSIP
jgi:hypothetical protein